MLVFMNEQLLKPRSRKPKITVMEVKTGNRLQAHEVHVEGRIKTGRLNVGTHVLKAWVEANYWRVVR